MTKRINELSMKDSQYINSEKVYSRMKKLGWKKKGLAGKIYMSYRSMINALKAERISSYFLVEIGRALDVDPEWLQDLTDTAVDDFDLPNDFSAYLKRVRRQSSTPFNFVAETLYFMMVDPEDLTREQWVDLSVAIYKAASVKLIEWGLR